MVSSSNSEPSRFTFIGVTDHMTFTQSRIEICKGSIFLKYQLTKGTLHANTSRNTQEETYAKTCHIDESNHNSNMYRIASETPTIRRPAVSTVSVFKIESNNHIQR